MAEEKKTPEKQGWFKKLISWIVSLPGRIAKAFKNMVAELRKVTWPSKKKLISSCITVLLFMLFTGVVVSLLDMGAATAVNGLYSISHPTTETQYVEDPAPVTDDVQEPAVEGDETVADDETVEGSEPVTNDETVENSETVQTNDDAETPAE